MTENDLRCTHRFIGEGPASLGSSKIHVLPLDKDVLLLRHMQRGVWETVRQSHFNSLWGLCFLYGFCFCLDDTCVMFQPCLSFRHVSTVNSMFSELFVHSRKCVISAYLKGVGRSRAQLSNQVKDLDNCLMSLSRKEFLKLAYDLPKLCMSVVDLIMVCCTALCHYLMSSHLHLSLQNAE
jgi:hypothetical protein